MITPASLLFNKIEPVKYNKSFLSRFPRLYQLPSFHRWGVHSSNLFSSFPCGCKNHFRFYGNRQTFCVARIKQNECKIWNAKKWIIMFRFHPVKYILYVRMCAVRVRQKQFLFICNLRSAIFVLILSFETLNMSTDKSHSVEATTTTKKLRQKRTIKTIKKNWW